MQTSFEFITADARLKLSLEEMYQEIYNILGGPVGTSTEAGRTLSTLTNYVSGDVTLLGARVGDFLLLSYSSSLLGLKAWAYVTASDTVKIALFNPTSGDVILPAGTWYLRTIRR